MGKNSADQPIVDKETFIDLAKSNGITPIEVIPTVKLTVQLLCTEDDFLRLASDKSKEVYYYYQYPQDHEIWITGSTFDNAKGELSQIIDALGINEGFRCYIDESIYPDLYSDLEPSDDDDYSSFERELKKEILDYNIGVDKALFLVPHRFMAFYLDNGCLVGLFKEIPKPYFSESETKLFSILSNHKETIEENIAAAEQRKSEIRERLQNHLVNDLQFKVSSNQDLRHDYAFRLWKDPKFKWMRDAFDEGQRPYPSKDYLFFIERVFKEMKYYGGKGNK